uniref:Uncharacterized protein n=1 Tax=Catagonus wagneri TaxID=51154 RepID=A0A8C3WPE3_9CETA
SAQKRREDPPSVEEQKRMEDEDKVPSPGRAKEAKLKARDPHPGGSDFLRKQLQKGQEYSSSGDYNTTKADVLTSQLADPELIELSTLLLFNTTLSCIDFFCTSLLDAVKQMF